jgi:hypothetical protein
MSSFTEGTPSWLLTLENAEMTMQKDEYIQWLINKAGELGVPTEVIRSQLQRKGYEPRIEDYLDEPTFVGTVTPAPKRGRKAKT